uniref:Elongation of very long chain fatty acids protein n=1 Tax=Megaselia scalaris TaxID=36166 RepID=T1GSR3_MEGSC
MEHEDLRTKSWFLSNNPGPLFTILATYLYFCLYAGPRYMRDRKPFELKTTMIVYNIFQVVLSYVLFHEGYHGGWGFGKHQYSYTCQPVTYGTDSTSMRFALKKFILCRKLYHPENGQSSLVVYIAKITELLDTVFFVLRKKDRQISFLHMYHHTLMPVCAFIGVKYFAGGHGTLLGFINSFIHIVMYAYYLLAAMGPRIQKYLWWKKYITVLQIVQFLIIFVHTFQLQFQPSCNFPKSIAALLTFNAGLFTYMFSSFYVKNYKKEQKIAAKKQKMEEALDINGNSKAPIKVD